MILLQTGGLLVLQGEGRIPEGTRLLTQSGEPVVHQDAAGFLIA
jgi:hypothetical protein